MHVQCVLQIILHFIILLANLRCNQLQAIPLPLLLQFN